MKRFVPFVPFAALVGKSWAQDTTLEFTNTTFTDPVTVGDIWTISWTTGNGNPVTLSIANDTWSSAIVEGQPVLPSTYDWEVAGPEGFISGDYQLRLEQQDSDNDAAVSPTFSVVVPDDPSTSVNGSAATTTTTTNGTSMVLQAMTITYSVWDTICGCHKTSTAVSPLDAGAVAYSTSTWWEEECGCHKTTVLPTSLNREGNYTAPTAPPMAPAPAPTWTAPSEPTAKSSFAPSPSSTSNNQPETYTGVGTKVSSSVCGLVALLAIAVFA